MVQRPSSRFTMTARWLAAAALLLGACGGLGVNSPTLGAFAEADDAGANPETGAGGGGGHKSDQLAPADGGGAVYEAAAPSAYIGSPLCLELTGKTGVCNPDLQACITGAYDGG